MHFLAHIHTKDTKFYTWHTTNTTQIHTDTDVVPLSHFALFVTSMYAKDTNFIFGMPQIYTYTDTQTHAHTSAEISAHTDRHMHTDIHKHACRHTQTHIHIFLHTQTFYIHKHTYIYVRSILPAHFIFSCHLPNELRSPCTYFCTCYTDATITRVYPVTVRCTHPCHGWKI